jgi:hypothetical protein
MKPMVIVVGKGFQSGKKVNFISIQKSRYQAELRRLCLDINTDVKV